MRTVQSKHTMPPQKDYCNLNIPKNFLSKDLSIQIYNISSLTYMGQFLLITQSSVKGNSFRIANFQTIRRELKIGKCGVFSTSAEVFVNVVKHCPL